MADSVMNMPSAADELLLDDVISDKKDYVVVRGRRYGVSWLKRGTLRKFTHVMVGEGDEDKVSCKACAAIVLNGYWRIKFLWWIVWRWFYYVRQYGDHELLPLMEMAKKKIPVRDYLTVTILATAMKDTLMQMTREEASSFLRAPSGDRSGS